jgi:hypothetical protein
MVFKIGSREGESFRKIVDQLEEGLRKQAKKKYSIKFRTLIFDPNRGGSEQISKKFPVFRRCDPVPVAFRSSE